MTKTLAVMFLLLASTAAAEVPPALFYASKTGSDQNACTSSAPCRSLTAAQTAAKAFLSPSQPHAAVFVDGHPKSHCFLMGDQSVCR